MMLSDVCLSDVCLTSVAYIRSEGGVCGRMYATDVRQTSDRQTSDSIIA